MPNGTLTQANGAFTAINNFQFFGANGRPRAFGVAAAGPLNETGTGTWTMVTVPVPAAIWLSVVG